MLIETIQNYQSKTTQEKTDQENMLTFIKNNDDVLYRSNSIAHMTSSAIVVNETMDKVLFAHHNIYQSYGWLGGHNDGNANCLEVALKEAKEESGLRNVKAYEQKPFMLDIISVENHIKHGAFISDHLHLNVTYLLIGDENDSIQSKPDENSAVQWFAIDEALEYVKEERMMPIYQKAFDYIKTLSK